MNRAELSNNYFLLRHGHSLANESGIIVSRPESGISGYGLTAAGEKQIRLAAESLRNVKDIRIYSSDFLRTRETSRIIGSILNIDEIHFTADLRERFFGLYDGLQNRFYDDVWERDKEDENNSFNNVESPRSVALRTASLISKIESEWTGRNILLVSHGDCLQILQTLFEGISPGAHRSVKHLQTGEIRKM